jgi:hypothetical protein
LVIVGFPRVAPQIVPSPFSFLGEEADFVEDAAEDHDATEQVVWGAKGEGHAG